MSRYSGLEKKARETIITQMDDIGEITTEELMEIIRPYYMFDIRKLRNQALRRTANSLMRNNKDDKGIRTCFSCKNKEGKSTYINIDTTKDLKALEKIELQLVKKYKGLNASKKKVKLRMEALSDQIKINEEAI
ncbi:hypothetical protein [Clostridium akagii]|uniref:hypothetical protein n=1 Tax=Clostridium akagii TaxID=91623 RepID=UPI00047A22FE|nr:hypothetical protein [Clostridium akagii]